MRHSIRILLAALVALAAVTASAEERVYLLRSQEDPSMAQPACAADENVILAAKIYAPRTTGSTGYVTRDTGKAIGTAVACGRLLSYKPFDPAVQNTFRITFVMRDAVVTASGVCALESLSFPVANTPAPLLLAGCSLKVNADAKQGILNGQATSSSVFTPIPLAGYHTGSFWTIQLYVDDTFGPKHPRLDRDDEQ